MKAKCVCDRKYNKEFTVLGTYKRMVKAAGCI